MTERLVTRRQVLQVGAVGAASAAVLAACGPALTSPSGAGSSGAATAVPSSGASGGPSPSSAGSGSYTPPGADATGEITINNWGDPEGKAVYAAVAARFQQKYPNVTVTNNFNPFSGWGDYISKVLALIAAGNAPDIINIAIEGIELGVAKDLFLPLDDYFANDPAAQPLLDDLEPHQFDWLGRQRHGKHYAYPGIWNNMVVNYNTKMFADAGIERPSDDWTWDEFLDIAKRLTANDVYGFAHAWFYFGMIPWFYSNGVSPLNEDWTASNLTDPAVIEAATFARDLVTVHKVAPQPAGVNQNALFPAGKLAMVAATHSQVGAFKNAGFTDWDVLPWPQKAVKATVWGPSGFAIYPQTKYPDLAWEYIKLLAAPETMKEWVTVGGANPPSLTALSSAEYLAFPEHAALYSQFFDYGLPVTAPAIYTELESSVNRAWQAIMAGTDVTEAFTQADQEVTAAFAAG